MVVITNSAIHTKPLRKTNESQDDAISQPNKGSIEALRAHTHTSQPLKLQESTDHPDCTSLIAYI